jgi:glutaredoxin-like protein NrdH
VDITEVPAALEYITAELGYSQVPVVVNNADDQDRWSGLRRDKLVQAAMSHKAA